MFEERKKRPRIQVIVGEKVIDPLAFLENCSSTGTARIFHSCPEEICIEMHLDKHCHLRQIIGEDDGSKREGIELNLVQNLVQKSFKHILNYYLRNREYKIINYPEDRGNEIRIVLQEENEDGILLNVAVECHFQNISKFEITVKTAMVHNQFRVFDGQFVLRIIGDSSRLFRFTNKNLKEINRIDL